MSRNVNVDEMTGDDARYLLDRPWKIDEAKRQGVDDIDDRIQEALASEESPELEEGQSYADLTLPKLKALVKQREVTPEGKNKADLVAALEKADADAAGGNG